VRRSSMRGKRAKSDPLPDRDPVDHYVLRLYVTGLTLRSSQAIARLRSLCEELLADRYDLEVIDVYQQPELARRVQLVAAPTLIKELPLPVRRLIGDLSDRRRVLIGLDLPDRQ